MPNSDLFQSIAQVISQATGEPFTLRSAVSIGGGCINSAYRLEGETLMYFVKTNRQDLLPMFEAEAEGLRELAATRTVRVPMPVCCGVNAGRAWLAMEYIGLRGGRGGCDRLLGQRLAALHRIEQPFFGWGRDNTIGSTPQPNDRHNDWLAFWRDRRLGFQLQLAAEQGYRGRLPREGEKLMAGLAGLFSGYRPKPSLLHGDLWGGNYAADEDLEPVIFDPACYYGDREADVAMTELFGGFSRDFFAAYHETWPLDPGYAVRRDLYNLYHVLNHLNLFGGGYQGQAESLVARLLAELR